MKKRAGWMVMGSFVIVLTVFLYVENTGNSYTRHLADTVVPVYLEAKGYLKSDIVEAEYVNPEVPARSGFYPGQYRVVFKDEPGMIYYYGITRKTKEVRQFCEKKRLSDDAYAEIIEKTTRHSEVQCIGATEKR